MSLPLSKEDESELRVDYGKKKVYKTEFGNASETLAELLSKKGSTQEAKETRDNAAAIQQEIVKFKFQHRATLGTVSRASSIASSRRSNKSSSIHSSASSAEKRKIAAADAAALKASLEYEEQASAMEMESERMDMEQAQIMKQMEMEQAQIKFKQLDLNKKAELLR